MEQSEQSNGVTPAAFLNEVARGSEDLAAGSTSSGQLSNVGQIGADDPDLTVREAVSILNASTAETLAVLDARTGEVAGILVRPGAFLLSAQAAPVRPRLGGMATPLGVYLHDGVSGGGAGALGLALCGAMLGSLGVLVEIAIGYVTRWLDTLLFEAIGRMPHSAAVLGPLEIGVNQFAVSILSVLMLLLLVRVLPLSGTHAAEHQVVHCIEQGVPLTIPYVRSMPRVHPRCGTNLLTGVLLFTGIFGAIFQIAVLEDASTTDAALMAVIAAAPVALAYWKRLGGVIQYWLATKPATDNQIAGAIRAAETVLEKRRSRGDAGRKPGFFQRIWAMGLPQVLTGYGFVYAVGKLASAHWPWLSAVLEM